MRDSSQERRGGNRQTLIRPFWYCLAYAPTRLRAYGVVFLQLDQYWSIKPPTNENAIFTPQPEATFLLLHKPSFIACRRSSEHSTEFWFVVENPIWTMKVRDIVNEGSFRTSWSNDRTNERTNQWLKVLGQVTFIVLDLSAWNAR